MRFIAFANALNEAIKVANPAPAEDIQSGITAPGGANTGDWTL